MTVRDRPVAADLEQRLAARFARAGLRDGAGTPAPRVVALGRDNHVGWEWDPAGASPVEANVSGPAPARARD